MGAYRDVYVFAARAGALEGFVYGKETMDPDALTHWVENLVNQYQALSDGVRVDFQDLCDGTVGRAIQSLIPLLGEDHALVQQLKTVVQGPLPSSPDDFSR